MNNLTICIPVYERYEYFESAIKSAVNQTINCEILVSDNASSHDKFKDFCHLNNIKYFKNQSNIGVFANWNKCLELANTDFALILSDDDTLEPNYAEEFMKALENYPQLDMFYTNFNIYDFGSKKILSHEHEIPFGHFENNLEILKFGIKHGLSFPIFTTAIKKSKFDGFQENFHSCSDWIWMYSKLRNIQFYGNCEILVTRGNHENNDSKNNETSIRALIGMSYLYGLKLTDIFKGNYSLKFKSRLKSYSVVVNLFAYNKNSEIERILNNKFNIYGQIIRNNYFLIYFPKIMLKLIYKLFLRRYFG